MSEFFLYTFSGILLISAIEKLLAFELFIATLPKIAGAGVTRLMAKILIALEGTSIFWIIFGIPFFPYFALGFSILVLVYNIIADEKQKCHCFGITDTHTPKSLRIVRGILLLVISLVAYLSESTPGVYAPLTMFLGLSLAFLLTLSVLIKNIKSVET